MLQLNAVADAITGTEVWNGISTIAGIAAS
jgi:hypothetical protein